MTVRSSAPRFEHHSEGRLGIGEAEPRLSWTVAEAPLGYRQEAAELEITVASPDGASHVTVHRVEGPDQVLVPWPAAPLQSRQPVAARVRFYDGSTWGPWSDPGHVEVGLLDASGAPT